MVCLFVWSGVQAKKGHLAYPQTGLCRNPRMGFFKVLSLACFPWQDPNLLLHWEDTFEALPTRNLVFSLLLQRYHRHHWKKNHNYCFCYCFCICCWIGHYRTVTELTILTSLINGEAWRNGEDGKSTVLAGREKFSMHSMKIRVLDGISCWT